MAQHSQNGPPSVGAAVGGGLGSINPNQRRLLEAANLITAIYLRVATHNDGSGRCHPSIALLTDRLVALQPWLLSLGGIGAATSPVGNNPKVEEHSDTGPLAKVSSDAVATATQVQSFVNEFLPILPADPEDAERRATAAGTEAVAELQATMRSGRERFDWLHGMTCALAKKVTVALGSSGGHHQYGPRNFESDMAYSHERLVSTAASFYPLPPPQGLANKNVPKKEQCCRFLADECQVPDEWRRYLEVQATEIVADCPRSPFWQEKPACSGLTYERLDELCCGTDVHWLRFQLPFRYEGVSRDVPQPMSQSPTCTLTHEAPMSSSASALRHARCYQGIDPALLPQILQSGLVTPTSTAGRLSDGPALNESRAAGGAAVFTSPSLTYASHPSFALPRPVITDPVETNTALAQVILEVIVDFPCTSVQGISLDAESWDEKLPVDTRYPNEVLEVVSVDLHSVTLVAILVSLSHDPLERYRNLRYLRLLELKCGFIDRAVAPYEESLIVTARVFGRAARSRPIVLFVEDFADEPCSNTNNTQWLERLGYTVIHVMSTEEAKGKLQQIAFVAIVLRLRLGALEALPSPGSSSTRLHGRVGIPLALNLCREVRQTYHRTELPIFVLVEAEQNPVAPSASTQGTQQTGKEKDPTDARPFHLRMRHMRNVPYRNLYRAADLVRAGASKIICLPKELLRYLPPVSCSAFAGHWTPTDALSWRWRKQNACTVSLPLPPPNAAPHATYLFPLPGSVAAQQAAKAAPPRVILSPYNQNPVMLHASTISGITLDASVGVPDGASSKHLRDTTVDWLAMHDGIALLPSPAHPWQVVTGSVGPGSAWHVLPTQVAARTHVAVELRSPSSSQRSNSGRNYTPRVFCTVRGALPVTVRLQNLTSTGFDILVGTFAEAGQHVSTGSLLDSLGDPRSGSGEAISVDWMALLPAEGVADGGCNTPRHFPQLPPHHPAAWRTGSAERHSIDSSSWRPDTPGRDAATDPVDGLSGRNHTAPDLITPRDTSAQSTPRTTPRLVETVSPSGFAPNVPRLHLGSVLSIPFAREEPDFGEHPVRVVATSVSALNWRLVAKNPAIGGVEGDIDISRWHFKAPPLVFVNHKGSPRALVRVSALTQHTVRICLDVWYGGYMVQRKLGQKELDLLLVDVEPFAPLDLNSTTEFERDLQSEAMSPPTAGRSHRSDSSHSTESHRVVGCSPVPQPAPVPTVTPLVTVAGGPQEESPSATLDTISSFETSYTVTNNVALAESPSRAIPPAGSGRASLGSLREPQVVTGERMSWQLSGKVIGRGANGTVFLGVDSEQGQLAAIKRLARDPTHQPLAVMREVELMRTLSHDNVVIYLDCAVDRNYLYICMEYISGGSLATMLEQFGRLSTDLAARYIRDVATGLQYLHSHDIVHRDIKPANILVSSSGCAKLSDFGTSRITRSSLSTTKPVGSPLYMAPELFRNLVGKPADIWALGITCLELLTGEQPWKSLGCDLNIYSLFYHITTNAPVIPASIAQQPRTFLELCLLHEAERRASVEQLLCAPWLQRSVARAHSAGSPLTSKEAHGSPVQTPATPPAVPPLPLAVLQESTPAPTLHEPSYQEATTKRIVVAPSEGAGQD
eukprot:TRINITY_DN54486_c0_g1_i1.p1 TRINITY_DN54486_c0_g1~~TRINITY_DN54486_c0_g1_i1.p1  ORF type:complete len:1608 (-),score=162.52 TRINITY_DN54486_c0_g1_i1:17-4840(-)